MRITFKRLEKIFTKPNAAGKSYPMIRIVGDALEGTLVGQEWSTKFFPSSKDMASAASAAKPGDILDITMTQKGNFLNPTHIEIGNVATNVGAPQATLTPPVVAPIVSETSSEASIRRENIDIAIAIMGQKTAKRDAVDYLMDAAGIADLIDDYTNKKGAFQFSDEIVKNDIPEADDAPLVKDGSVEEDIVGEVTI